MNERPRIILITGAVGAGQTSVGRRLAEVLRLPFYDANNLQSRPIGPKIARHEAMDEAARGLWFNAVRVQIASCHSSGISAVFACSTMREKDRELLIAGIVNPVLIILHADPGAHLNGIRSRPRRGEAVIMVQNHLPAFDLPENALTFDAGSPRDEIVDGILRELWYG